ncbi:MAG: response regulator [Bacillota bacterium]|nr:response regulator [Bacillota bacterium]
MYNVIIVEDDLMVCAILQRQIGRFQQLKLVGNFRRGVDALEWLGENPEVADLIILDYYMPGMTGIEFLSKLRESNKEIQVIMITSANEYSVIRSAMCYGICDYVLKPFTSARLEKAVSKFDTVMKLKAETHVWTQEKVDVLMCPHKHYNIDNSEATQSIRANKINAATLANVREYMQTKQGIKMPLTEISEGMGLSTVTVRRYLKHLNSLGEVNITLYCKTGGRPSEIFEYKGAD